MTGLVALTKWPGLLVAGDSVTEDQAAEIIIRTSRLYFSGNDHEWLAQLAEATGLALDANGVPKDWHQLDEIQKKFNCLDIEYLQNGGRVTSAWIGGPMGWMRWDGRIYTANYNIGKWPSVDQVQEEWSRIAAAWPFLRLRCQLLSGEIGEPNLQPVVEFEIAEGAVERRKPLDLLTVPAPNDPNDDVRNLVGNPMRERGCDIARFRCGLALAARRPVG